MVTKVIYFTEHESSGTACGGAKLDSHCEPKVKQRQGQGKITRPEKHMPRRAFRALVVRVKLREELALVNLLRGEAHPREELTFLPTGEGYRG